LGRTLKKVAGHLSAPFVDIVKYVFAEMVYVPRGWHVIKGWNDQSVADAQESHWPTLVKNLQGRGPPGVAHFPWHTTREDRADHNVMFVLMT